MVKSSGLVKTSPEWKDQITGMTWLRLQHPVVAKHTMHIGNERKTSYWAGWIMKQLGVLKGASDLFMAWPNTLYHGLFIEVKSKTGRPTIEQREFIERMNDKEYYACFTYGADELIDTMKWYLNIK